MTDPPHMNPPAELTIRTAHDNPCRYMPLLLIGDESETMINRYLHSGTLYVASLNGKDVAVCLTTDYDPSTIEVKNLAVLPEFRRRGIGRAMLSHVEKVNSNKAVTLGTGETPSTLRFYHSCGYVGSHRIPDFFTLNYDHPIVEEGVLLTDMVYLTKHSASDL